MSKPKRITIHKPQLCTGNVRYVAITTRYGTTTGFRCSACGAELCAGWKKALHHVAKETQA